MLPFYLQAQLETPNLEGAHNLATIQQRWEAWAADQNLEEAKGWKWLKRWEQQEAERAGLRGDVIDDKTRAKILRSQQADLTSNRGEDEAAWLPAGPNELVSSPSAYSSHGTGRINCITFHPSDANVFWLGVAQGGIWKTTNGGQSYTPLNDGLPILRISDIAVDPNNTEVLYACLGDFEYNGVALQLDDRKRHTHYGLGLYKSINGGSSWEPTGLTLAQEDMDYSLLKAVKINPNNSNELLVAGLEGVWRSTDAGTTWSPMIENRLFSDLKQDPSAPETLYAASMYSNSLDAGVSGIYKTTDFGETWTLLQTDWPTANVVQRIELCLAPSNSETLYALTVKIDGGMYGVYRSTDGGQNWEARTDENSLNILYWYSDGGDGGQGNYDLVLAVDPEDENRVYAGGVNMWGSEDGGTTWNGMSYWTPQFGPSVHADQHQGEFNPLDGKFYLCNDGGLYQTNALEIGDWSEALSAGDAHAWPTEWNNLSGGLQITSFYRLGLSQNNPNFILAGAQDNGTYYHQNLGWSNVNGGDGMEALIDADVPQRIIASSQFGRFNRSNTGGAFFQGDITAAIRLTEDGEWTTPMVYDSGSQNLFTAYGNVWVSDNFGDTWTQRSAFENAPNSDRPVVSSALAVCAGDSDHIYVAKRPVFSQDVAAELYATADGGTTWTNLNDGLPNDLYLTAIAVDDEDGLTAWVAMSGFAEGQKVFKTTNGGSDWENLSLNLPNLPVNTIIMDQDSDNHRLYIGTDLGVYTFSDDEAEWLPFCENLPAVIVSELEINYTSKELHAATFGRGIWTTPIIATVDVVEISDSEVKISAFPNPSDGRFSLQRNAARNDLEILIVNVLGDKIYTSRWPAAQPVFDVDLSGFPSGAYFVRLSGKDGSSALQVLVGE